VSGCSFSGTAPTANAIDCFASDIDIRDNTFDSLEAHTLISNASPAASIRCVGNAGANVKARRLAYARAGGFRWQDNDFSLSDAGNTVFEGVLIQGGGVDIDDVSIVRNKLYFNADFATSPAFAYRVLQNNVSIRDLVVADNETASAGGPVVTFNASGDGERENWKVS
jgi:hypothetical protein